ncbi:MAG: hypothetical protein ACR2NY_01365 [Alphaproteobacteria bacterium]
MTDTITYSPLYFCNSALLALGTDELTNFDDTKLEAKIAKQLYPLVLDGLLTRHRWRFLLKENLSLLPIDEKNSIWQKHYPDYQQYQLPNQLLLLLSPIAGNNNDYIIADNILLSRAAKPTIDCLLKTTEEFFPVYFAKLLVSFLMAELALPITEDITRADFLIRKANREFKETKKEDALLTDNQPAKIHFILTENR